MTLESRMDAIREQDEALWTAMLSRRWYPAADGLNCHLNGPEGHQVQQYRGITWVIYRLDIGGVVRGPGGRPRYFKSALAAIRAVDELLPREPLRLNRMRACPCCGCKALTMGAMDAMR